MSNHRKFGEKDHFGRGKVDIFEVLEAKEDILEGVEDKGDVLDASNIEKFGEKHQKTHQFQRKVAPSMSARSKKVTTSTLH